MHSFDIQELSVIHIMKCGLIYVSIFFEDEWGLGQHSLGDGRGGTNLCPCAALYSSLIHVFESRKTPRKLMNGF